MGRSDSLPAWNSGRPSVGCVHWLDAGGGRSSLHGLFAPVEVLEPTEEGWVSCAAGPEEPLPVVCSALGGTEEIEPEVVSLAHAQHAVEETGAEDEVHACGPEGEGDQNEVLEPVEPELQLEDQEIPNERSAGRGGRLLHAGSRAKGFGPRAYPHRLGRSRPGDKVRGHRTKAVCAERLKLSGGGRCAESDDTAKVWRTLRPL